jgi:hypothetical protein
MEIIETVLLPLNTFAPGMSFEEAGFRLLLADIAVGICIIGGAGRLEQRED